MKFILIMFVICMSITVEAQDAKKTSAMSVEDVLKLPPTEAIVINKLMDSRANVLAYLTQEEQIAKKLSDLNKLNSENSTKKPIENMISRKKATKSVYVPVKIISIWSDGGELVGLFNIGRNKVRMKQGGSFNGYELKQLTSNLAVIQKPNGKSINIKI